MKVLNKIVLTISLLVTPFLSDAQLRINEVMQSNIDGLYIENDFPDSWVELKNTSTQPVDIKGWGLSVKDSYKKAYIFPDSQIIKPGGFFLIYCDKESRGSHTDFRVDSGKGVVKLWDPAGNEIESVNLAKFPAPEVACGVSASGKWEYFVTPTPGKENTSATSSILLPQPSINPAGGVYSAAVKVAITTSEDLPADAKLCVTTDGREPTLNDAVKGLSYTLTISNSTPLRAKFISLSSISPRSHT